MAHSSLVPIILCLFGLVNGLAEVQVGETTVTGTSLPELGLEFFGGISFAEPPVGALRFTPPILKLAPGVPSLNATQFGSACTQFVGGGVPANNSTSEDCLTLNVLRPAGYNMSNDTLLPVLFWVYGGAFYLGSTAFYDASPIVNRSILRGTPVIYVSSNYRLGPLGYPQGEEAEERGATNLGNKDVIAALTWVQNNIAAFGGDKDKVTLFGGSAGAMLISQLLLNQSFDLARAAILKSGSANTFLLKRARDRESTWNELVSNVPECMGAEAGNTFDCLRSASPESMMNATSIVLANGPEAYPFTPVIDGPGGIIPDLPSRLYARGEISKTPFIAGTNLDEGTLFIPTSFNSTAQLREWLISNSTPPVVSPAEQSSFVNAILRLYPNDPALGSPFGTGEETFGLSPEFKRMSAVFGDMAFSSPRRQWARAASKLGVKVFAYLLTEPQTTIPPYYGVWHSADYVFTSPPNGSVLQEITLDYWISFVTSLDPNDGHGNASRALWTQYTPKCKEILELNSENLTMIPDTFRAKQIAFLSRHSDASLR